MREIVTKNRRLWEKLAISLIAAFLPLLLFRNLQVLEAFELRVLSFLTSERGTRSPNDNIILVTVDDKTVAELGSPLPRRYYADLIQTLNQYGAKAIVFDFFFAELRDQKTDDSLAALSKKFDNVIHAFTVEMWENGNGGETNGVVLDSLHDKYTIRPQNEEIMEFPQADTAYFPHPYFTAAFNHAGLSTLLLDADERFQKLPLIFKYAEKTYPTLSLAALCTYFDLSPDSLRFDKNFWGYRMLIDTPDETYQIPINRQGQMHLNFYGPFESFRSYSVFQIHQAVQDIQERRAPRVPLHDFEGKIVIVGSNELGNKDSFATPFSADFPGMGILATAVSNYLNRDALVELPWYANAGIVLGLGLVLYLGLSLAGKVVKMNDEVYAWLIFMGLVLAFNFIAYTVLFKSMHIATPLLQINSALMLLFLSSSYYEKSLSVKNLNRRVFQLESEINEKLSHIDLLSTKISSQDELYRIMESFIGGIERILKTPTLERPHPLEAPLQKLVENQKVIKEQLENQLNRLRAEKERLQDEKEKLEIEKSVYERMAKGEKVPALPSPEEPPLQQYEAALHVLENYKAFVQKKKVHYNNPDQTFGMVTAGASEEIGKTSLQEVFAQISRYAALDYTVMITGENGTGKELVAKAIVNNSSRRDGPFVILNCASIHETLIESELFGYVKGAFTGANTDHPGAFEQADGGTIFLDEIGDLALDAQAKLLRVLQDKTLRRVGGNKSIQVDVRVIAATNRDLQQLIQEGKFRNDLYFRLNVATIHLPPLRERKEDIPHLVHYSLDEFNQRNNSQKRINDDALMAMVCYDWPGNIRELQNIVVRMCIQTFSDTIQLNDLPEEIQRCYRELFKRMPIPLWESVETATQTTMNSLLLTCQEMLRLGNVEQVLRSGQQQLGDGFYENCYDCIKALIDSKASLFPQDKRERLAKQTIVAMLDRLLAWSKEQKLGPMEHQCREIEKLLGRTRRMIDNWRRDFGYPPFYAPKVEMLAES